MVELIFIPFILALVVLIPGVKRFAFLLSLIPLAILVYWNTSLIGQSVVYNWLPQIGVHFHLSVDPLSLLFLFLTAIIIPVSLLAGNESPALVFLLEGLLFGFFTARDLVVFTLFWEGMLIPLYFLISHWGGPQKGYAALKFILYMIAGSALMVAAVLSLYFSGAHTFDLSQLSGGATWIFVIFALAFAVKTPLFPFHGWLPDAYTQASTAGTILLSAILSKAGIYGFIRIGYGIFPSQMQAASGFLLTLAIVGVFYGGFAAWWQKDFKRLIAYSSLSHVNFILAGLFILSPPAHAGAILQALNHGVNIAALFLVVGWLQERLGSTHLGPTGLCKFLPHLCWLTLFFVLTAVALPGTNNFVGELMILLGLFKMHPWAAAILALSIILSVIYMLRFMQKSYFEQPTFFQERWKDIGKKELLMALPLVLLILWLGIYPSPVLELVKNYD